MTSKSFSVEFVRRREINEYDSQFNKSGKTPAGEPIEFRAYVHRVIRNYVAFEWDTVSNTACLRISQLPGKIKYEHVRKEFNALVSPWLDISHFQLFNLHKGIVKLLKLEKSGKGITRAQGFDIHSLQGRSMSAKSNATDNSVFGEASIDAAFELMVKKGVGNQGNFYWLPKRGNPLSEELRVALIGNKNRVNFTSPSNEAIVRHVLSDIRKNC